MYVYALDTSPSPRPTPVLIPNGSPFDYSRTGITWLDTVIDVVIILGVIGGVLTTFYLKWIKPTLNSIQKNVRQAAENSAIAREHTENSHATAKNPNLRDDLDAKHNELVKNMDQLAHMMVKNQERTDKEMGRINDTLVNDRQAMRTVEKQLDEHIQEKRDFGERITKIECELEEHRTITEE